MCYTVLDVHVRRKFYTVTHILYYSIHAMFLQSVIYIPTDAHNRCTNCTFVLRTPICFDAKVPSSGSLKYKGAQTLIHETRNKFYF
jgi:hypothetical protein